MFQTTKKDCEEIMKADKWCVKLRKTRERTAEVYTIDCEMDHPDFSEAQVSLRRTSSGRVTVNLFVETDEGREPVKRLDYDPAHPDIPKYRRRGVSATLHQVIAPNRGHDEQIKNPHFLGRGDQKSPGPPWDILTGFLREVRVSCPVEKLHEWYHDLASDLLEVNDEDQ